MKKQILIVAALLAIVLIMLFPAQKRVLTDIVNPGTEAGFSVAWPGLRYIIEPFSGAAEYLLSFTRYIFQLSSWMFWLLFFALAAGLYKKEKAKKTIFKALKYEMYFLSLALFCLLLPFPAPRLTAPKIFEITDFHSHTFYSHDGLVSPEKSLRYHKGLGFNSFFLTEHGHTGGFDKFPVSAKYKTVFPGMQVSTTERVSLLILSDREFDGSVFSNKSVKEVIDLAHARGFLVVCPHWWKWRYFTWQQLYDFGLDGFEIYNAGYRKFSQRERADLITFCKDKRLLMTGSTDWHGWGNISNVWTAVENTGDIKTLPFDALRKHTATKVLVLERPKEILNTLRYCLEPFFGTYYYFASLNRKQVLFWTLWIVLALFAAKSGYLGVALRLLPPVLCLTFVGLGIYSLILWLPLLPENQILGKLLAPVCFGIAAGWFFVLKYQTKNA